MSQQRWSGEWHIVDTRTGKSLESHEQEKNARFFCNTANEHERDNGRPMVYVVQRHSIAWRKA